MIPPHIVSAIRRLCEYVEDYAPSSVELDDDAAQVSDYLNEEGL